MSSIEISKEFTMPRKKLRKELDQLAAQLTDELQLECEWQSDDCLNFKRSGATGQINIGKKEVGLAISLGMLLIVFRGAIEEKLQAYFDEHIY